MATYTYDPSLPTDRDKLRLKLSDTRGDFYFANEELDAILAEAGSVRAAVVSAAKNWLATLARHGGTYSNDRGSVSDAGRRDALESLIREYGGAMDSLPTVSVTMPALRPFDTGFVEA